MFSKYDVYTTTQSIYCYPDGNVLKNKLNIKDNKLLKTAEEEINLIKQNKISVLILCFSTPFLLLGRFK